MEHQQRRNGPTQTVWILKIEAAWTANGGCMDSQWRMYGQPMEAVWKTNRDCMDNLWRLDGTLKRMYGS
jgi:hypothetical protein